MTTALSSRKIKPRKWQYIAATYDYITGYAKLYLDSKVIAKRKIGRIRLATNYPVRMGARRGDRRYFRGRISCVMVFDVALNPNQIARRKKRCFRGEVLCLFVSQSDCLSFVYSFMSLFPIVCVVCLCEWIVSKFVCLFVSSAFLLFVKAKKPLLYAFQLCNASRCDICFDDKRNVNIFAEVQIIFDVNS